MASNSVQKFVLTLNAGSSCLKFALFRSDAGMERVRSGIIDRSGKSGGASDFDLVMSRILPIVGSAELTAVGHRIAHGGPRYWLPQRVDDDLLDELWRLCSLAPKHLPREIELIEVVRLRFPNLPQIACFDTAFHHELPQVARMLPIPRRYEQAGVRRYGFHGLSYQFLMEELVRLGDPAAMKGRVILAHLGNGASMAAVRDGRCLDTSMGFTPASGLPMGTRSGDLDPGLASYFERTCRMSGLQFERMVNCESGLLGVSETSSDMRELLALEPDDRRAAEAVALFCYQAKKWIGSFAAALGGLDTLVFAGGIGENSPAVRRRVCAGLGFLGLSLEEAGNEGNASIISAKNAAVSVRVIHTNEELVIARSTIELTETCPSSRIN